MNNSNEISGIWNSKQLKVRNVTISYNAYCRFVQRICNVITDADMRSAMIVALNLYISGHTDTYADALDATARMCMGMLLDEIDRAMQRSVKAREKARARKDASNKDKTETDVCDKDTVKVQPSNETTDDIAAEILSTALNSRKLRRAKKQAGRVKSKWKKIG